MHSHIGLQHAPAGCGQGFGWHVVHSAYQILGCRQSSSVVRMQDPVLGWQHAPSGGCGQGFGAHAVHSGCQTPGNEQEEEAVIVQAPVGSQQAPICGQTPPGRHADPVPRKTNGGRHAADGTQMQLPVATLQHAPGGGQGS